MIMQVNVSYGFDNNNFPPGLVCQINLPHEKKSRKRRYFDCKHNLTHIAFDTHWLVLVLTLTWIAHLLAE